MCRPSPAGPVLSLLVVVLLGCGSNATDEQRGDALAAERIITVEPPGTLESGSIEQHPPQRDDLTLENGPTMASRRFEVDPGAGPSVLGFYLDELEADGWREIDANCRPAAEGRTALASVLARKRLDTFTATVKVSVSNARADVITVRVTMSAPFHTDAGDPPTEVDPQVPDDCATLL